MDPQPSIDGPSPSAISVDRPEGGRYLVPSLEVATNRANYMARQATGSGPAPGNDLYDSVLEQETNFALSRPDILQDWARMHMRHADLERYRVDAS